MWGDIRRGLRPPPHRLLFPLPWEGAGGGEKLTKHKFSKTLTCYDLYMNTDILKKTFSSLRHRNFRLFFTGQTVSLIGTWVHQTAMSWLIYDVTGSKFMLGLISALSALPMFFVSIFGGVIADRFNKRKVIIATQSISMVLVAVLAVLVLLNVYKIWHIVVIAVLLGTNFAVDMPVRQAFLIDITGKDDLMNGIALNSSIVNLARVVGPAIAGIIMVNYGISWCFVLNSLSFLAVIIALCYLYIPDIKIKERTETIVQYTLSGFRYVKQNKTILEAMLIMALMGIFGWSYALLIPALAKDVFMKGEQGYAMLVSANGTGALIGALIVAYIGNSPNKRKIMKLGIYFYSLMIFLLSFSKIYWISLLLIAGAGMGLLIYFSSCTTLIQSGVEDSVRGRVMGIWALVFGGMMPIGNLFAGVFAQHFGVPATLLLSSLICPIFTFFLAL